MGSGMQGYVAEPHEPTCAPAWREGDVDTRVCVCACVRDMCV